MRIAIPPLGSRLIALTKDTSLASTVTVVKLTRVADQLGATNFRYMDMFIIVGTIYWIINQLLTILQTWPEETLSRRHQLISSYPVPSVMRDLAGEGMTMLVVTHETRFARDVADRIVFMEGGHVLEDTTPARFFSDEASERCRQFLGRLHD